MEVSVVVPVFNSAANLDELSARVRMALAGRTWELILVNDQSADESWSCIRDLARCNAEIVGINLRKNSGQDNAIMAGLNYARGRFVAIMDDDLQHAPADIPRLISACEATGADVCFARFETMNQKKWKNAGSWLNGKVANRIVDKPDEIYLSPYKVIRREVCEEIIRYDGPFPYIDGLIFTITRNVTQIDALHHKRHRGAGNYNLIRSLRVFMRLATSFSIVPLRVASLVGSLLALCGFGFGVYYLVQYFADRARGAPFVEGWTSLAILVITIGGMILLSLGAIGEYIGRAYLTINRRPQYTIKEIVNQRKSES